MSATPWDLVLPSLALGLLGWAVPRLLARVWPEGLPALLLLAAASAVILTVLSAGLFLLLYAWRGAPPALLLDESGAVRSAVHFLRLGLASALIWAPLMILSVAGLPRRWTTERW